ncbi:DUF4224 domain-containing protein [Microbulbifer sp. OS29]|uniref:DUF4224 domain-containing protein n=1 Tax=Microbulbifer okhotskensis TaxID=2926617 RepID=A0A9X2EPJ5_9GAMM|nr:DUF4224 domain-containing protein [Microbulbifer okhotskensis]MCO1334970.1 DUF4224 domain-containing protein [Microbulbifer okhotskensis]
MSEILTDAQLRRLTGAKSSEAQKLVLEENQIPYVRRKDGTPAVTWAMVNQSKLASRPKDKLLPLGFNLEAAS